MSYTVSHVQKSLESQFGGGQNEPEQYVSVKDIIDKYLCLVSLLCMSNQLRVTH